jgi:hypothetical protein
MAALENAQWNTSLEAQETSESELEQRIQDYIQNELTERDVWKEP